MGFSINTNAGAMLALQTLSATNRGLEVTQNRISTGYKVASTKDDSGTYAIAQGLRADLGGLNAVKSSLDRAQSTLDVAVSAAESISDVLNTMKEKATAASDTGMDADSRKALQDDFNKLSEQIASYINSAEFNGSNILKSGGANLSALLNADDATQTIKVVNVRLNAAAAGADDAATPDIDETQAGALTDFLNTTATATDTVTAKTVNWTDDTDLDGTVDPTTEAGTGVTRAKASADSVNTAIDNMKTVLSKLGSASRQITAQQDFTSKLSDTIEAGIGNLVDADLAKESARLTALQTQQQLGLQALSIANQAPQSVLSLFR
ncbi:flagellin [Pedomonas mirosovicensis]|uniref:flagellin n=1 Tax=Pedomonas mirosovicensis TaxID=2908641 RepID=UPI0021699169|nr:flagellin [Pedomonas mirosovicensis]MCH8685088.1 flagellin [Pedomonas mirosovicensis]